MKADPQHQKLLLDLAAADATLAQLRHRQAKLPERTKLLEVEKELQSRRDDAATVKISLDDINRDIAKLDAEVETVRRREERDQSLLDSGTVTAKAMADLDHELASLKRRQTSLEDDELELMEQREATEANYLQAGAHVTRLEGELSAAQDRLDVALAGLADDVERVSGHRKQIEADLPADLAALYENQRAAGGVGAALFQARRCGACRLELTRSEIAAIASAAPDELITCPDCNTYLIRTNESGL